MTTEEWQRNYDAEMQRQEDENEVEYGFKITPDMIDEAFRAAEGLDNLHRILTLRKKEMEDTKVMSFEVYSNEKGVIVRQYFHRDCKAK